MGQYELTAAPPLTLEEWNAQSVQVRDTLGGTTENRFPPTRLFLGQVQMGGQALEVEIRWWSQSKNRSLETTGPCSYTARGRGRAAIQRTFPRECA